MSSDCRVNGCEKRPIKNQEFCKDHINEFLLVDFFSIPARPGYTGPTTEPKQS
jgi:hypothetical protein